MRGRPGTTVMFCLNDLNEPDFIRALSAIRSENCACFLEQPAIAIPALRLSSQKRGSFSRNRREREKTSKSVISAASAHDKVLIQKQHGGADQGV